ncbi:MAG TPA: hypothetical protein VFW21_15650 [Mycobacterium sp.]|nr:hypothetical protein [Mycobacterium sp.]
MTAPTQPPPPAEVKREPWLQHLHPVYRLILRWAYIAVLSVFAFHASLLSVVDVTRAGGLGGYVWVVPIAGILTAIGVARRNRTELPIHDRQTDVIVGTMGLVLALLLHAVLLQRYALYFYLLRLDLVAMWLFVVSATVALFGLRPVIRFGWVWALMLMVYPFPYYLLVVFLGGTKVAAAIGTVLIAVVATAIVVGRHPRRAAVGSLLASAVGLVALASMVLLWPDASLLAYQLIPALTAICLVATVMFLGARRGAPKRVLDRKIEPLAARQIWSALPVVFVVAVALSLVRLPSVGFAPATEVDGMHFQTELAAPAGWHVVSTRQYTWVRRMFGEGAVLVRQQMVEDNGDFTTDKFGRPRTVMVDTITARRPMAMKVFPGRLLYHVEGIRLSGLRPADLDYGVKADIFSAIDDKLLVTWTGVQWVWSSGDEAQRVFVIAVDNHEDNAPFPQPTGGLWATLNAMFTVFFRGSSAATDNDPNRKDDLMLAEFAHRLVRAQLEPLGVKP